MEPLVELPLERWVELNDSLKKCWPLNLPGYYALKLHLEYPGVRQAFQFKVFTPNGKIELGFISESIKGIKDWTICLNQSDTTTMEDVLLKTKVIVWTQPNLCVDLISSQTLKCILNVKPKIGLQYIKFCNVKAVYLRKETNGFPQISFTPDTYVAPVKEELISQVDNSWPYKYPGSYDYFLVLAKNGLSYGLYSNDKLVAWVFINEYHFLANLYVIETVRRKGLAELLVKYVVNEQLTKGNDVYTYIENGNKKSFGLFKKLGFEVFDDAAYAVPC